MLKALFGSVIVFIIAVFSMVASSAFAAPLQVSVDCATGGPTALQDGIDFAREGATVSVTGDCSGASVVVATDGLTLFGNGSATITGDDTAPAITITGAHNVTVENFALIDGAAAFAISVRAGGSAVVRDILLITGEDGVLVSGGFLEVNNSNVVGADDDGILAIQNATLLISDSDVSGNGDVGVIVASNSAVQFNGGNTVNNNGGNGLLASNGNAQFNGANTVQDNGAFDINCFGFSRILVFQSITSSSRNTRARDCLVAQVSGAPLFVDHPFNLVDCTPPGTVDDDSINEALANGLTDIIVRGICDEHVSIGSSNVTIRGENLNGGPPDDGIDTDLGPGIGTAAISVGTSQRVNLNDLKIFGGRNGVTAFWGSTVIINNSEIAPVNGGNLGVFVGEQSFASLVDSKVTDGGILAARGGVLRLTRSTVTADSGGDKSQLALNLFGASVADVRGATFEGTVLVNSNSVLQVRSNFIGTPFGPTVVNSTAAFPITCQNFGNITQDPNTLVDASFVPLTEDDVSIAEIARNVPGCTLTGF